MTTLDTYVFTPETEREHRQCYIEDPATGAIRFTATGFKRYGHQFAKAGIDINRIKDRDSFREACKKSQYVVWDEIRNQVKGHQELEDILKPLWS